MCGILDQAVMRRESLLQPSFSQSQSGRRLEFPQTNASPTFGRDWVSSLGMSRLDFNDNGGSCASADRCRRPEEWQSCFLGLNIT